MLSSTVALVRHAQNGRYAVGAYNIYNLEGVCAVVAAAEAQRSPAILQIHPPALGYGGTPLIALCLAAAQAAAVPIAVHLDHSTSAADIDRALDSGISSIMADGSHLEYAENRAFTQAMAQRAHAQGVGVEAELGRLTGSEDDIMVHEYESRLTDPAQAAAFVEQTGVDFLAVCIGNVHGRYPREPHLDFERLKAIQQTVSVPLVLHGASGLPEELVRQSIELGVCKFNVNTEIREAYLRVLRQICDGPHHDVIDIMKLAREAMQSIVEAKQRLFGASGKAFV